MRKQKVYLMQNDFGLYKIGISVNPNKRSLEVSNSSGVPTKVIKVWDSYNAYSTEQKVHKEFAAKRKSGEWFKLSKKELKEVDQYINKIDALLPCKVEYPTNDVSINLLPCQDIKKLLTTPKNPKDSDEIGKIVEYQHFLLERFLREQGEEKYDNLVKELRSEGFWVEVLWVCKQKQVGKLCKPVCTYLQRGFPICRESEKSKMVCLYIKSMIRDYESGIEQCKKDLERLEGVI